MKKKSSVTSEVIGALGLYMQLGMSMAVCIFLGVLAGKKLDQLLGTRVIFLIIFSFIGAIASFKVLYDYLIKRWRKK